MEFLIYFWLAFVIFFIALPLMFADGGGRTKSHEEIELEHLNSTITDMRSKQKDMDWQLSDLIIEQKTTNQLLEQIRDELIDANYDE